MDRNTSIKSEVRQLYLTGMDSDEIASIYGRARSTIVYHLKGLRKERYERDVEATLKHLNAISIFVKGKTGGLLEGEGMVTLSKHSREARHQVPEIRTRVEISNNCEILLKNVKTELGIGYVTSKAKRGRRTYIWCLTKPSQVHAFLIWLMPHLIVKRVQAKIIIKWCQLRGANFRQPLSKEETDLIIQVREANYRGGWIEQHS